MKPYSIKELTKILKAKPNDNGCIANGVSTDSRQIKKDVCFFAIVGDNFDGRDFVAEALNSGAACAVVNNDFANNNVEEKKLLRVDNTVKALGRLATHYRQSCGFKVIAITGSAGKTTTRHIIAHVLATRFRVFQSPKNFNNEIGLPLTLLTADPDDEIIVAEIGANKPGEIEYLSDIAGPDIAVVTNIHPAHLEGFGNIENIIAEKLRVAKGLKTDGRLLINADYPALVSTAVKQHLQFETFSLLNLPGIIWDHNFSGFSIDSVMVNVPLPGKGNLENALAAWAVCRQLGISPQEFADAIKDLPAVAMRSHIRKFGSITVIDDCYNANPGATKNALEILKQISAGHDRRAVFIFGDMAELGEQSNQLHIALAADIVGANVKLLLTVGPLSACAASAAVDKAEYDFQAKTFNNTDELCDILDKFVKDNDIVLVKGSRSVALEKVVDKLRELFDESRLIGVDQK